MQENKSKKSCNKQIITNNNDVSNATNNASIDNITMKTVSQNENTTEQLGVMALAPIRMQFFKATIRPDLAN